MRKIILTMILILTLTASAFCATAKTRDRALNDNFETEKFEEMEADLTIENLSWYVVRAIKVSEGIYKCYGALNYTYIVNLKKGTIVETEDSVLLTIITLNDEELKTLKYLFECYGLL